VFAETETEISYSKGEFGKYPKIPAGAKRD
jgi:hypothetical protein